MAEREPTPGKNDLQAEVSSGAHKRRTEHRLVLGGFLVLLVVGGLLVLLLLGRTPAVVAVAVILAAVALLLALYKGFDLLGEWLRTTD